MEDCLILVDRNDQLVGKETKEKCHEGKGLLHRAFSVWIFNEEGKTLIQKRTSQKLLWPGYWSNSVCSHPRWGEETTEATIRRIGEELGILVKETFHLGAFLYQSEYGGVGSEYEYCHLFWAGVPQEAKLILDPNEISEVRWMSIPQLSKAVLESPNEFTPWFLEEFKILSEGGFHFLGSAPI